MRKFITVTICVLLLFATSTGVFAAPVSGTTLATSIIEAHDDEVEQIELMVKEVQGEWGEYLGKNPDKIDFSRMYQVYYLKEKDINAAYKKNGDFVSNISDKYYWVVPCFDKQCEVQVVRKEDNSYGWYIRQGTRFMKNIGRSYPDVVFGISAIYENILKYYPEAEQESFRMVYDGLNKIHIMYFTCDGSEYVVPYFSSKGITWIANEKIYLVADYVKLMSENKIKETGYTGGSNKNQGAETIYRNYVIIGTAGVVCVAVVAIVIARVKRKNKKNKNI